MRPWLLTLVGCTCSAPPPSDTGLPVDTEVDDTEPADTQDTAASDTAFAPACVLPLEQGELPAAWDEIVASAAVACVRTQWCEPDLGATLWVSRSECEGWRVGWYDGDGRLVAEQEGGDETGWCDDPANVAVWYGEPVRRCTRELALPIGSPPCAVPDALPTPTPGCVADDVPLRPRVEDLARWTDIAALGRALCVGLASCALGDRTLDLVYVDADCGDGEVDAWDHATGALVATLDRTGWSEACGSAPHWVGEDLSACLPLTFSPSEACGVATLP